MKTLDEWVKEHCNGLKQDIETHLDNASRKNMTRMILTSVRHYFDLGEKAIPICEGCDQGGDCNKCYEGLEK